MLYSVLSLISRNTKSYIKQLVECPRQILASFKHIRDRFSYYNYFGGLLGFPDLFGKVFLINLKLSLLNVEVS